MLTCKTYALTQFTALVPANFTGSYTVNLSKDAVLRKLALVGTDLVLIAELNDSSSAYKRDITVYLFASDLDIGRLPAGSKYLDSVLVAGVFLHAYWNTLNIGATTRAAPATPATPAAPAAKRTPAR